MYIPMVGYTLVSNLQLCVEYFLLYPVTLPFVFSGKCFSFKCFCLCFYYYICFVLHHVLFSDGELRFIF